MTRNNYYYLVSGLPDMLLDDGKGAPAFRDIVGEVRQELSESDFELVSAMLLPIDNRNLAGLLDGNTPFDDKGLFTKEELSAAIKGQGIDLPEYMQTFLAAHRENRQLFPGMSALDQLSWLFYDEMEESANEFVREWCAFDINLRNVAVGVTLRKELGHVEALATDRDRPATVTVVGRGEAAEAVLRSTAPDFGLAGAHAWVERVNSLSRGSLTEMEKGLDEIRWDMLTELTDLTFFQAETVAAFVGKLVIVDRWARLEPAVGREKLNKLVDELMKSFVMPEGF